MHARSRSRTCNHVEIQNEYQAFQQIHDPARLNYHTTPNNQALALTIHTVTNNTKNRGDTSRVMNTTIGISVRKTSVPVFVCVVILAVNLSISSWRRDKRS